MERFTVSNGYFCAVEGGAVVPRFGDAEIEGGKIVSFREKEFSSDAFAKEIPFEDRRMYNAAGRVITAPLVNFHDHIYSRLAKGLALSGDFSNFPNILENLWWKLDRLLDLEMTEASAQLTAIESIRNGVSYIIDHHSSPVHAKGSLAVIQKVLLDFSIRNVLCFETTDRNGKPLTEAGLQENLEFAKECSNEDSKALFGLHASFTLDDETLKSAAKMMNELGTGSHTHLCEDLSDGNASKEKYGAYPLARLMKHKLLNEKSIVAHGLHLTKSEFGKLASTGAALALNVDSNMNNAVGLPPFDSFAAGIPFLLGTDGMHANLARAFKQVFLAARYSGLSFDDAFGFMIQLYFDQITFIQKFFPDYGTLGAGSRADFVVWEYAPPAPLHAGNFWGHYIYGVIESPARSLVQNGAFLMKDYELTHPDANAVRKNIYEQGERLAESFRIAPTEEKG